MGIADLAAAAGASVRVTSEEVPRYAIADLMRLAVGDVSQAHVSNVVKRAKKRLDLGHMGAYKFAKGKGKSPLVCTMDEAEQIVGLLGGSRAATYRATGLPQAKNKRTEDLYVMRYSFDEAAVKIGRSHKTSQRRSGLQAGQNFWVETLAIFPGKGYLEIPIHKKLKAFLSSRGAGTEWFDIHVSVAVGVVSNLIQELETEETEEAKTNQVEACAEYA